MPDQKITDLGDGGLPQPTDDFVVARAGTNNKLAWSSLAAEATVGNVAVTLDGNTAGALALVSSGTLTLAGGNNITLSQAGNAVTISGAAAGGAQTAISGIVASDATYTSGTVTFTGVGGGVTVSSNTGQRVDISVAAPVAQTVQTQNVVDVTISGNTAGALALISSGTMTLAGGNNITISQAGNALTISGPNVGGAQTGISGLANSETTYTSGTVSLSELGAITIRSTTGQQFQFSVNAQSVQPETQTFIAGISASDTLYTSGNVRFTGSQAVTVRSGTGQLVVIDVPVQSVQPETQTFIAGISASDTLYTSGNVRFTGVGGGVTVSSNTGQRVDISVAAQSVQPETQTFLAGLGNSETTYTSGTVNLSVVAGNLTIRSTTGQAFQFSMSQTVQPETQTAISGIANSQTTYTSGTVSLSELGAITIRSTTGNQYQFSVNSQTVQTQGVLSAGVSTGGNTAGNTTVNTGSRFVIVASGNATASQATAAGASTVTISVGTQTVQTQGVLSAGVSTGGNTLGDTTVNTGSRLVIVGSNGITASQGTAAGATTITLSGVTTAAQTVQTQGILSAGVSTGGNTAGNTTVNTGSRLVFVGTNMVSLSQTTGAGATTISINATQSAQTQSNIQALYDGANSISTGTIRVTDANGVTFSVNGQTLSASVNQSLSMFAVSNTTQSSSGTAHKSALSFAGAGGASVGVTGGTVVVSVPTGGGAFSGGMSTNGNTSGDTGYASQRLNLVGGNNITLSGSTNGGSMSLTISAPNLGAGAMSAGVSNLGNTAGSTGVTGTRLVLAGTNMVSLSQSTDANGGTVSINATQSVQTQGILSMGVSTGGATSGDTTVNTGSRMVFVGTNATLSQGTAAGASTITISVPATSSLSATGLVSISTNGSTISIGATPASAANWENMPAMDAVLYTHISGVSKTPFYWPENIPGIKPANIALRVSMVTASADLSVSVHFGVYTFVNSTSAALLGSASDAFVVSSASSVSFSAQRNLILTSPGTVTAMSNLSGGNYLFGLMFSASATGAMNASLYAATQAAGPRLGMIRPGTNQLSTATSQGIAGLYGRGSTTVNAMPANVVASEVVNQGIGASSPMKPYIFIRS